MNDQFTKAIVALWIAWLLYWYASARNVKPTRWRASLGTRARYRVPAFLTGALLIGSPRWLPPILEEEFLPPTLTIGIAGIIAVILGLGFTVWARRNLGRNWSAEVAVKESHTLVRTGPYRYVRHPIYTGMLGMLIATGLSISHWITLLAAIVVFAIGTFIRVRIEERLLRETFGQSFDEYARAVPAVIPGIF